MLIFFLFLHASNSKNFLSSNTAYAGATAGPGSVGGAGSVAASNGGVSTIDSNKRGHPLKSFSVPGPPPTGGQTPINKHSKSNIIVISFYLKFLKIICNFLLFHY